MIQIAIINGPNLNLLGLRQPEIYGSTTFETYFEMLEVQYSDFNLHYYQSNHEGDLIDKIHGVGFRYEAIILNAGAYTHTSIAIADAIKSITTPVIEVHISDIYNREAYRQTNFMKDVVCHSIIGKGLSGYNDALQYISENIIKK